MNIYNDDIAATQKASKCKSLSVSRSHGSNYSSEYIINIHETSILHIYKYFTGEMYVSYILFLLISKLGIILFRSPSRINHPNPNPLNTEYRFFIIELY